MSLTLPFFSGVGLSPKVTRKTHLDFEVSLKRTKSPLKGTRVAHIAIRVLVCVRDLWASGFLSHVFVVPGRPCGGRRSVIQPSFLGPEESLKPLFSNALVCVSSKSQYKAHPGPP